MSDLSGFLNIDKPLGVTSHDVVARVRRVLQLKRVGHAGTLDPLATGVLIVCVGPATRLSEYVMDSTKRYEARVHLGATTETYDAEGEIVERRDAGHIQRAQVEAALRAFLGPIEQLPPMYSAVKQGGRKLYELARAGREVERSPRSVTIHDLRITQWSPPEFTLQVTCGPGTYIRSLAHDLGQALGVGAYLAGLIRVASGAFTLDAAVPLDTFTRDPNPARYLIAPRAALADRPSVTLDDAALTEITHGRPVPAGPEPEPLAFAFTETGALAAVLRLEDGLWKPQKVFLAG